MMEKRIVAPLVLSVTFNWPLCRECVCVFFSLSFLLFSHFIRVDTDAVFIYVEISFHVCAAQLIDHTKRYVEEYQMIVIIIYFRYCFARGNIHNNNNSFSLQLNYDERSLL